MKIIHTLAGILVCALPSSLFAQNNIVPLQIGDPVPEMILENMVNYQGKTARFSDFKGKLLILDFWATWCRPCVDAIPRFQELQAEFGDQIQILMVTSQPISAIAKFFSDRKISLPSVTGDQKLSKMFPHKYVPHEVWIQDGKVVAITGEAEVTANHIKILLTDKKSIMAEKKSNFNYDLTQPLLFNGNGGQATDLLYHSVFTGYLDGIGGGGVYTDSLNRFKIRALNGTVLQLYQFAMRNTGNRELAQANRCIQEFDIQEVLPPPDVPDYSSVARDNYYCYELIVPIELKDQAGELMMEDLNRFFGARYHLRGMIERRTVKCWALRKTEAFKAMASPGSVSKVITEEPNLLIYRKQPFSKFYHTLAGLYRHDPFPVIDQTGITSEIDITFPIGEKNIRKFSDSLESYGLRLVQDSCEIDMLVIKQFK
jgi:thiol-disulfide isomerase/thioredoxin